MISASSLSISPTPRLTLLVWASCLQGLFAAAETSRDSRLPDAAMHRDMATVRELIREAADPNAVGLYETPALLWVVRIEDHETAKLLLEAGADPNQADAYGLAPLHLAAANADHDMIRLLLAFGAEPNLPDGAGEPALFLAARTGAIEAVEALLAGGAAVDRREPVHEQTALHVAAREGHADTSRLLVSHGADVNAQTRRGATPAFRLPSSNAGSKGVGIIRGGWPERGMRYPIPGAKTPLLYATRKGSLATVRLLVESGASVEMADADGVTPLMSALMNASVASPGDAPEHLAAARYLIDHGADVNAVDWYGQTPLSIAVDVRNLDVTGPTRENGMDRAQLLEFIRLLLDQGADPNARLLEYPPERRFITRLGSLSWVDFTGQTPFLRAALAGDTTVMELLVEHGADPGIATFGGTTPLMAAAGVNWVVNQTFDEGNEALLAAVRLAHALGNDVDAENAMGIRAIHGAANRGSDDIIRFLVENGADITVADAEGRTPLDWAKGVFLATHPPVRKVETVRLLGSLSRPGEVLEIGN